MRSTIGFWVMLAIVGCETPPGPGPQPDGGDGCESDLECDDGSFCNGAERCAPDAAASDARGCAPASDATPCEEDEMCSEVTRSCEAISCSDDPDRDGDGHDSAACSGDDCDDGDPDRFPGNTELCDTAAHDEDCDPTTLGGRDADGDGHVDAACCNLDAGGDRSCGTDCDDTRDVAYPGNSEVCDRFDNDCDSAIDEGVGVRYFDDCDGDGIGGGAGAVLCAPSMCMGHSAVTSGSDCVDTNAAFHPGAAGTCGDCPAPSNGAETCNGLDDDCSGTADDNDAVSSCAATLHGTSGCTSGACGIASCDAGYHECSGACAPSTALGTCGTRCTPCPTPADPNAHATCDGTSCGSACNPPYTRLGGGCARLGASHVDDPTLLPSGTTALHVLSGRVVVIDTDTGAITDSTGPIVRAATGDTSGIGFSTQAQAGSGMPELAIFTFSTITVDAGGTLTATGSRSVPRDVRRRSHPGRGCRGPRPRSRPRHLRSPRRPTRGARPSASPSRSACRPRPR